MIDKDKFYNDPERMKIIIAVAKDFFKMSVSPSNSDLSAITLIKDGMEDKRSIVSSPNLYEENRTIVKIIGSENTKWDQVLKKYQNQLDILLIKKYGGVEKEFRKIFLAIRHRKYVLEFYTSDDSAIVNEELDTSANFFTAVGLGKSMKALDFVRPTFEKPSKLSFHPEVKDSVGNETTAESKNLVSENIQEDNMPAPATKKAPAKAPATTPAPATKKAPAKTPAAPAKAPASKSAPAKAPAKSTKK